GSRGGKVKEVRWGRRRVVPPRGDRSFFADRREGAGGRSTTIRDVIRAPSRPCRPPPSTAHLISRAVIIVTANVLGKCQERCRGSSEERRTKTPRGVSHVRGGQRNSHSHH